MIWPALIGLVVALGLCASPAAAQSWRSERDASRNLTAALAVWPSGHAIVIRCQAGDFQTFVRLPHPVAGDATLSLEGQERVIGLAPPHGETSGATVFAREPGRAARWLAGGGGLRVDVEGREAVLIRLPDDGSPVRAALRACGQPLESPRDYLLRAEGVDWASRPSGEELLRAIPRQALRRGGVFHVLLSCLIRPDGRVADCEVEQETPAGFQTGPAAVRLADRFRMEPPAPEHVGGVVLIPVNFYLPES